MPQETPTAHILRLQTSAGNRAIAALLRDRPRTSPATTAAAFVQRNEKFDTAAGKAFDQTAAPEEMELPPELKKGLEAAWAASFPEGKSVEQGGILVKAADGKYVWRAGVGTGSGSFKVNYSDLKPGEELIASGHTHPYDVSEGAHTDIAFSGGDLSNLVWQSERVKVVQSGTTQFAVAKTKEFDELVAAADTAEKKKALREEMDKEWKTQFSSTKKPFKEKVEIAAKAVCSKYHLIYYAGGGGTVKKDAPLPKVHVESKTSSSK